jgi:two-component system, chemotaxis family, protein-glutamate methylesterase/glutaminase
MAMSTSLTDTPMRQEKTRVLVVDDSAFMRQLLSTTLSADPGIEVVGTAADPLIAREKIKQFNPDIVTLDIEMPNMDGLEFLRRLMSLRPTRVLMISSLTQRNAEATIHALQLGAIDCLEKPQGMNDAAIAPFKAALIEKIHLAAAVRMRADARPLQLPTRRPVTRIDTQCRLIAIGASTGGVEALSHVLQGLPADLPPIAIVQHMPGGFTGSFARRLDAACALDVQEAYDGLELLPGHAALATGGFQMEIVQKRSRLYCSIFEGGAVSGHAPSVDVLFHSVAGIIGPDALGVILTGMGKDGAQGLLAMREAGAFTLGQDEASALVYGMPRAAYELGAVIEQSSLGRMASAIMTATEHSF